MTTRILKGGKTITVNPDLTQFPLYGDKPKARFEAPGSIAGNVAMGVLLWNAAEKRIGMPEPTWAKVVMREIDGELLFVITPVKAPANPKRPAPDTYPIKLQKSAKTPAPAIRGLKRLVQEASLDMRPGMWYEVDMEPGEDEGGPVVCGSWTKAVAHKVVPRTGNAGGDEKDQIAAGTE